jgi:hypothetical protein
MNTRATTLTASFMLALAAACPAFAQGDAPGNAPAPAAPKAEAKPASDLLWIRSRQDENRVLRLQLAIREFVPKQGGGPTITLHGAVHIADRAFYKQLEKTLEQDNDIILFEGVKPGGLGNDPLPEGIEGDLARTKRTEDRLRLAWTMIEHWRHAAPDAANDLPFDLAGVRKRMTETKHTREQALLASVSEDGWGRPFVYSRSTDGKSYSLGSLGKDNALGGDGPDKDIFTTDLPPLKGSEIGEDPGLQKRLAETFGLSFQLDEMAHAGPKWVNADMSIDQVQDALGLHKDGEGEQNMLFALLDGSSLPAKIASMALGLVEAIPGMAPRMKVMMVEMLANLDESALSNAGAGVPGMGDMKEMMKVIIEDRNQVVIDDLKKLMKERPELKRIAVIYGAGHLADLSRRLEDQLGYEHKSGKWITAIRVDLNALGITDDEMRMTRSMMATQMKMLSGKNGTAAAEPK